MKAACLSVSIAVVCAALLTAQVPVTPPAGDSRSPIRPASRAGEYHVIAEGCVQGDRLKELAGVTNLAAEYLNASEWVLEAPREQMQQLRNQFDRHHVEVTGIAILPLSLEPRDMDVNSHRLPDGTRITIGGSRSDASTSSPPRGRAAPVRLKVESITVLNVRCG